MPLPTIADLTIPEPLSYTFTASDHLIDAEGDNINIAFSVTPSAGQSTTWMTFSYTGGVVTLTGTPPADNAYAATYLLTFTVTDQFDGAANDYDVVLVYL